MKGLLETIQDFYIYPSIGPDDWRYVYQTAQARAMEMQMLPRSVLLDMANAPDYQQAVNLLATSEYGALASVQDMDQVEKVLLARRAQARELFAQWMLDDRITTFFRSRDDFLNLRLGLKRMVSKQPIGADYSQEGNVPADRWAAIFEQQDFDPLPSYLQEAVEQALVAYYQTKDIRRIDLAMDQFQSSYSLEQARRIGHVFIINLFRIQIDLNNIRTILRLKLAPTDLPGLLLDGGFLETDRLNAALEGPVEALPSLFHYGPYQRVVDEAVRYLLAHQSFLGLEQACDDHVLGFLRSTVCIASGPQPIIAYLLQKEHQIRMVRFILVAKRHHLQTGLIVERLAA
ncbi:MAG: V-type ATPase subunit [Sedimentisphaerales bacterium]|nr:V-type ATPase subunit [Sedimentisphaerales bacterium]